MSLYELEAFGLIEKATTDEELLDILNKYGDYGSVWLRVMARKEALDCPPQQPMKPKPKGFLV